MKRMCLLFYIFSIIFVLCGCGSKEDVFDVGRGADIINDDDNDQFGQSCEPDNFIKSNIFVYVCGSVNKPGVYELPEDSRVYEAVSAAGGISSDAYIEAINMAELLSDGEQIYVPSRNDAEGSVNKNTPSDVGAAVVAANKAININKASVEELMTISGIGKTKAESIVSYRNENGKFLTIEDITKVSGIGDSTFNKIKDKISVK